jgi:hypothetical protein
MEYYKKKKSDLDMGLKSEKEMLIRIRKMWGNDIESTNLYNVFDYISNTHVLEIKTRRCKSNDFDDIIIGLNKLKVAETTNDKISIFIWRFTDCCCYWIFNKKEYTVRLGGSTNWRGEKPRYCGFVKTKHLIKF